VKPAQLLFDQNQERKNHMSLKDSLRKGLVPLVTGLAATTLLPAQSAWAAASINKGDTAWMLIATCLVVFMTVPGLAMFYGGLVRSKNVLSVLMQVMVGFCLIAILWVLYGYSLAFTNGNAFIGSFDKAFMNGITYSTMAATFSKETYIPEMLFLAFQMTFAAITPALIIGAFAERMKFSAVLLFISIWFTFSYLPMAHMVWWWAGPDCLTLNAEAIETVKACVGETAAADFLAKLAAATDDAAKAAVLSDYASAASAMNGWLFNKGALDFAGGSVVHINAGVAGLVCAIMLGKRVGLGREAMAPHNLTVVAIGTGMLLFGWFGFNAGSNLEANGLTAQVVVNTILGAAAATLAWSFGEWLTRGHASLLGAASGMIAGLVAITPACGWVGPMSAIVIGALAGFICLWAVVWLKKKLGYDDALDVFGVHGVGGIVGALLTGIFVNPNWTGGWQGVGVTDYVALDASVKVAEYVFSAQMTAQFISVITAIVLSAVVSVIALFICKFTVGLRVDEQAEREGLDISSHGERAYS
jgi:ammonium transporter, Amt family